MPSSHTPLVVGNWKMNPQREKDARKMFTGIKENVRSVSGVEMAICAPFVFLPALKDERGSSRKIALGAQDVFWKDSGSFTGEISPAQLADFNVQYALIGHSERRELGESNEQVAEKAASALKSNFNVVVCVGEHKRDDNGDYLSWLEEQITNSLSGISGKYLGQLTIAYEPIWAIGAKEAMQSTQIHEMVVFIRRTLARKYGQKYAERPRIIYGGSVNAENIEDIMQNGEVDGVLPGRASREPEAFAEIVKAAQKSKKS